MKQFLLWVPLLLASCIKEKPIPEQQKCTTTDFSQHPKSQYYEQQLQHFHTIDDAPGTLLAIQKESEPLWIGTRGKANLEEDANITPCTQFRTGSITKVFTAVLILKLREQGALKLDDAVADYLPEIKNNIPASATITIRQLLNHNQWDDRPEKR